MSEEIVRWCFVQLVYERFVRQLMDAEEEERFTIHLSRCAICRNAVEQTDEELAQAKLEAGEKKVRLLIRQIGRTKHNMRKVRAINGKRVLKNNEARERQIKIMEGQLLEAEANIFALRCKYLP